MAITDGYNINIKAMEDVAGEMQQRTTQLQGTLDRLEQEARTTLDEEHWSGAAKGAYTTAKANWDRAAADLRTKLHAAFTALIDIIDDYSQAEANAVKSMDHTGLV
jgi:WXG100 family type VII secretion target